VASIERDLPHIPQLPDETLEHFQARSSAILSRIAFSFEMKYEERGQTLDLDEAIRLYRHALTLLPATPCF